LIGAANDVSASARTPVRTLRDLPAGAETDKAAPQNKVDALANAAIASNRTS
jgi:hypothetical protein